MFKDGNFATYSFNKEDIAKVFLIEGNYKKLCKFLNRPVFKELEQDLEHYLIPISRCGVKMKYGMSRLRINN